jgi:hypothetical protein
LLFHALNDIVTNSVMSQPAYNRSVNKVNVCQTATGKL